MPPPLPLTSERLERHGLYLIEDGQTLFLWIGRDAVPQLVMDVFNLPNYEVLRGGKVIDLRFFFIDSPADVTLFRPRCQSSTIPSHNVSMPSSRKLAKYVAVSITSISILSRKMENHRSGCGLSAVSFKIAQMSCRVTSSSSLSSRIRYANSFPPTSSQTILLITRTIHRSMVLDIRKCIVLLITGFLFFHTFACLFVFSNLIVHR